MSKTFGLRSRDLSEPEYPLTAIRSVRAAEGKFVQVSNDAAQDRRLSCRARGILLFVLSLPPEKHFTAKWLESQIPEGREAVRSALHELEACGYFRRERRHGADGRWAWEQVISDTPLSEPCDGKPSDGSPSDGEPSDKELNTETLNTEDQKMASRRAHASSASANWTIDRVVRDVREAVAQVHGQREADELSDGEALGLFYVYVKDRRPRDLVAYVVSIIGCAPYLDTFMSNVESACTSCGQWESNCACPVAA